MVRFYYGFCQARHGVENLPLEVRPHVVLEVTWPRELRWNVVSVQRDVSLGVGADRYREVVARTGIPCKLGQSM